LVGPARLNPHRAQQVEDYWLAADLVRPKTPKPDPRHPIAAPEAGIRIGSQRDMELAAEQ